MPSPVGAATETEAATGDGTVIAIIKRLRTLLNGGLPAALGAGGGLKIDGSGTALPVSGTITATSAVDGATTDVPSTDEEGATARTGISLWKGIKNYLRTLVATAGATNGAAVVTDADGTLQQYLRGLVKLLGTTLITTKDGGPAWTPVWGVTDAPVTSADMSAAAVAVTDAPTAGQKIVIDDIVASGAANMLLTLTCEDTAAVVAYVRVAENGQTQITWRSKRKLATADKKVLCQTSAAGAVEVLLGYHSEA